MNNKLTSDKNNSPRINILKTVSIPQLIMLTISVVWIKFFFKDDFFKFLKPDFWVVCKGVLLGAFLAFSGYLFYRYAKKSKLFLPTAELFEKVLSPVFKNLHYIDLFYLSVLSGFVEELFFRGLLYNTVGIIISSIAFGALHFPGKKYWIYFIWATFSGFLFAFVFMISGSLWLPISAHITNNIIGMILLKKIKT